MRRPQATAESKARAERIARSLAGLLNDVPAATRGGLADEDDGALPRPPAPAPGAPLVCPRCAGTMETVATGQGVEIDQCLECGAIWLDAGELEQIVAEKEPAEVEAPTMTELRARMREIVPSEGAVKYLDCPRCQQVMRRTNFGTISGVVVDECVVHGVLLDPGELQAIEAFVQMGGRALGEEVRVEQGQRLLAPPAPVPEDPVVSALSRRVRQPNDTAVDSLWYLLFHW